MESKVNYSCLKEICGNCYHEKGQRQVACPFRSISNEYCDEFNDAYKQLQRLEKQDKVIDECIKLLSMDGCNSKTLAREKLIQLSKEKE